MSKEYINLLIMDEDLEDESPLSSLSASPEKVLEIEHSSICMMKEKDFQAEQIDI